MIRRAWCAVGNSTPPIFTWNSRPFDAVEEPGGVAIAPPPAVQVHSAPVDRSAYVVSRPAARGSGVAAIDITLVKRSQRRASVRVFHVHLHEGTHDHDQRHRGRDGQRPGG